MFFLSIYPTVKGSRHGKLCEVWSTVLGYHQRRWLVHLQGVRRRKLAVRVQVSRLLQTRFSDRNAQLRRRVHRVAWWRGLRGFRQGQQSEVRLRPTAGVAGRSHRAAARGERHVRTPNRLDRSRDPGTTLSLRAHTSAFGV